MELFDNRIFFAGRAYSQSLRNIFERLSKALSLFRSHQMDSSIPIEDDNDKTLLEEALTIFGNPTGLPDGSAVYGILFNRLGFPATDENFFGAGW